MAIKVSGITVLDDQRNLNVGVLTATSLDVPPQVITFSPTDGSSDVSLTSDIVITFNANVEKGSGNITLRDGSASGTIIETIAVSSGSVSISGGAVTINPSDFPTGKDIFVVVDDGAFTSASLGSGTDLINTYNFTTGPITVSSFSPADGATSVAIDSNIVITFSENIAKGSGNITLRAGSASGTVRQTIDVTSGAVSVSTTQATINPPSDLQYEEDTYVVVDAGCFTNTDGDAASANAIINTYNFTTESEGPSLGDSFEGGTLICKNSNIYWIVAPDSSEVSRSWYLRDDASTRAQQVSGCSGWFVPSYAQTQNPGWSCRAYWNITSSVCYWTNCPSGYNDSHAQAVNDTFSMLNRVKPISMRVRAFRCVSY